MGAVASGLQLCLASLLVSASAYLQSQTAMVDSVLMCEATDTCETDALSLLQVRWFHPLSPAHGLGIVDELEPEISEISSELYHSSTGRLMGSVADEYADAAVSQ